MVGRIIGAVVAAPLGVMNLVAFSTIACSVMIYSMLGAHDIASFTVVTALYGMFSGGYITFLGPMLSSLSKDVTEIGARMGIAFSISGFGALIGAPINGALVTTKSGYVWWRPIVFSGTMCLAGSAAFAVSRLLQFLAARKRVQKA